MYNKHENHGLRQNYLYPRDVLEVKFNVVCSLIGTHNISPTHFFQKNYSTEISLPFSKFYIQFQDETLVSPLKATHSLFIPLQF